MNRVLIFLIGSAFVLIGLFVMLANPGGQKGNRSATDAGQPTVMLYCAASNRAVMESIHEAYENEYGVRIDIQYGPSQTLLSSIEISHIGDLYLPADDSYLEMAKQKDLIAETIPIAKMKAVVAVAKGNPKSIHSYADLVRDDVRLVLANPDTAAIGNVTRNVLTDADLWKDVADAATAYRATVNEVAGDIAIGAADAGIVYDAVLHTYDDVEFVELPELSLAASDIAVGVIRSTKQATRALHFARYLSAADRGLEHYRRFGFHVATGDRWADHPEPFPASRLFRQICSVPSRGIFAAEGFRWQLESDK